MYLAPTWRMIVDLAPISHHTISEKLSRDSEITLLINENRQSFFQEVHLTPSGRMVVDSSIIYHRNISESRSRDSEITLQIKKKSTIILPGGVFNAFWKNDCRFSNHLPHEYFGISWKRFRNNFANQEKIDNHSSRRRI